MVEWFIVTIAALFALYSGVLVTLAIKVLRLERRAPYKKVEKE